MENPQGHKELFHESQDGVVPPSGPVLPLSFPRDFQASPGEAPRVSLPWSAGALEGLSILSGPSNTDPLVFLVSGAAYALGCFCRQDRFLLAVPARFAPSMPSKEGFQTVEFDAGANEEFKAFAQRFADRCHSGPSFTEVPQVVFVDGAETVTGHDLVVALSRNGIEVRPAPGILGTALATSLAQSMAAVLEAALRDPGREFRNLPLLGDAQTKALVLDINDTGRSEFLKPDLFELISGHLSSGGRRPAVVCGKETLAYSDLKTSVEAASARLSDSGVQSGQLIGICMPRSLDMVVSILAVLRNGCAYVPLDPSFPKERLEYIIQHSGLSLVIGTPATRAFLGQPSLSFLEITGTGGKDLPVPPPVSVPGASAAYVIYTSGSTGKPKGVAVPRSAAANLLLSMVDRPGLSQADVLCAITTLSFDISVLELLAPLCVGATVVVATEEEAIDPRRLMVLLEEHRVSVLQATPITWRMLCDSNWAGSPSLKALCGGEALSAALAKALVPLVGELWNMYGPTETTVWSTCRRITGSEGAISIGSPIANTSIYVLDDHGRPLPAGAEGKFFIGGAGLALGYYRDEAMTAKRFLPDPFSPGGRIYDTGDLARFDADGLAYICGRSDFQVKLNGYRIELEEIESCLTRMPSLGQVAVVLADQDSANPEIVAYYTLGAGSREPSVEEFRQHCSASLPRYMVPGRWEKLEVMPRTPNGKTDRKALLRLPKGGPAAVPGDRKALGMSKIQEQFLVNSSLFQASNAYVLATMFEFSAEVDEVRLRDAWDRILGAVPILRSVASEGDGVSSFGPADPGSVAAAFELLETGGREPLVVAEELANLPVPPWKAPLAKLFLIRPGVGRSALLFIQHHIVTDLFSSRLLAQWLGQAYDDPGFIPEALPYSRFVEAEAAYLAAEAGEKSRAYWAAKVAGCQEALRLPHASARPEAFEGKGRSLPWSLSEALVRKLDEAETQGKAPFLLMLTAYAALLHRLSGQGTFLIGVPFTNRLLVGEGPLMGPCVNILPVLVAIDGSTTFEDLYAQLRKEFLLNNRHQAFPFMKVASEYKGVRDPLRPFILQAGFTNEALFDLNLGGQKSSSVFVHREGSQMDLFFSWWKKGSGMEGAWEYNTGSYGAAEVRGWQDLFSVLVAQTLDRADQPVARTPLLAEAEASRLAGRGRDADNQIEKSLAHHLRDSFTRHAQGQALSFEGKEIGYSEMGTRVARVASFLHRTVGQGVRIAVMFPRSPEMLYAVHGIVQSGNAYVPLGIDWPRDRILDVLKDIRPALVLGAEEFRELVEASEIPFHQVPALLAETRSPATLPEVEIGSLDPVYILYTSGTTGRPKGAVLPHGGLVNRLAWMQDEYRLSPGDTVLLKTPYTFDVSVWELFWPFLAGARLVISTEGLHRDPREILGLIERESVQVLHFVPSMLTHFLSQPNLDRAASLRDVICSGEALPPALVGRFYEALPGATLHNLYGPTEASIDVTYWKCSKQDQELGVVPIGYPIDNIRIHILDTYGNPCPPFVKGEIFIGGVGLAKGYWDREEQTREKFIPNPFGPGMLYKTGDWGRYRLDGAVEYLERIDSQIKIHGIRVEIEEIEARLRRNSAILEVLVKKGAYEDGEECLIAYYRTADNADLDVEAVKLELRTYLPEAMVPGAFVRMDVFPLNANGKLDRKSFPSVVASGKPVGPVRDTLDEVEKGVERAWVAVLGSEALIQDRNFFDSGGNSLRLLSLRKALETEFRLEFKILDLFQNPTVGKMAALVRAQQGQGTVQAQEPSSEDQAGTDSVAERARRRKEAFRRAQGGR